MLEFVDAGDAKELIITETAINLGEELDRLALKGTLHCGYKKIAAKKGEKDANNLRHVYDEIV